MNKARAYMGVAYWITLSSLLASCSAMTVVSSTLKEANA